MTQVQRLVAGVDLGTTKVTGIIGEVTGDARAPGVKVLGVGSERTVGIRRGVVRDIEETTRAIAMAMSDAQLMAGVEVGTVHVSISGEHVSGRTSHGVVSVTGSEIRTGDVARGSTTLQDQQCHEVFLRSLRVHDMGQDMADRLRYCALASVYPSNLVCFCCNNRHLPGHDLFEYALRQKGGEVRQREYVMAHGGIPD